MGIAPTYFGRLNDSHKGVKWMSFLLYLPILALLSGVLGACFSPGYFGAFQARRGKHPTPKTHFARQGACWCRTDLRKGDLSWSLLVECTMEW